MDRILKGALMALAMGALSGMGGGAAANTFYFQLEPSSFAGPPGGSPKLYLFGPPLATGTVSGGSGFSQTFTLDAAGYAVVDLPAADILLDPRVVGDLENVENKGFSVSSSETIKAYVLSPGVFPSDMIAPIDAEKLGTDYVVAAYHNERFDFYQTYDDQITVQATEDNTTVRIGPAGPSRTVFTLNAGQAYIGVSDSDLTGLSVTADKPIAVQSGTLYADIPNHPVFSIEGGGHVVEQLPSIDKLSSSYLLPQMPRTGFGGNVVRVIATADNTQLQINSITRATLNKGEYYEGRVAGGEQINASHPVLVAEYMLSNDYLKAQDYLGVNGDVPTDSAMTIVPGADQWLKRYVFARISTAPELRTDYAAIVIKTASLPSLRLAGATVDPAKFTAIGSTGYSYGSVDVSDVIGVYEVSADTPFELLLAGLASGNSYLTYGGATFSPGAPLPPPQTPAPAHTPPDAHGSTVAGAETLYVQIDPQRVAGPRQLMIFGSPFATGTVSGSSGFSHAFTLDADGYAVVNLSPGDGLGNETVENKGYWITSSAPLGAYYLSRGTGSSDMTALLKGSSLGRQYQVVGYHYDFENGEDWTRFDDQVSVQATQDNTTVTISPTRVSPFTLRLNAGQTYRYAADHDISGSSLTADKPIVVQSGNVCAEVPNPPGGQCGYLLAQLPPLEKVTSTHFLLAPTPTAQDAPFSNVVRVFATVDGTEVTFNGGSARALPKGGYTEERWTGGLEIQANHPVLVVDYLISQDYLRIVAGAGGAALESGPSMAVVPGTDQWQKSYVFATPSGAADFPSDYASIVIRTGSLPSLQVGGAAIDTSEFHPLGSTGYSYGRVDISGESGAFKITADTPFGLLFAGFDNGDSYLTDAIATPPASPPPPPPPSDTPDNAPPVAHDDNVEVGSGGGDLLVCTNDTDPDGDVVNVVAVSATSAKGGTVTLNEDGSVHYMPAPGYSGDDSFSYTVADGRGGTDSGLVKVTVAAIVGRPPGDGTSAPANSSAAGPGSTTTQGSADSTLSATGQPAGGGSFNLGELLLLIGALAIRRLRL